MRKQIIVVALLALNNLNANTTRAQPPEAAAALVDKGAATEVRRAEASAQIMAFATETMRSQLPPAEFSNWPLALRDALPYWLEYQPFEAWSPQLQQFVLSKFEALAADPEEEAFAPANENKAAVKGWLQEKRPFENAQLRFDLGVGFGLSVKNQDGAMPGDLTRFIDLTGGESQQRALARFISSLSAEQKAELFASKMRLPLARLSRQQKQIFEETLGAMDAKIGDVSIRQFPNAKISIDYQFRALMQRTVAGKEEKFEVQIARPFDFLAR